MTYIEPGPINADLSQRAVVDSSELDWHQSPQTGVERRLLERDGGEVARATSIVRYAANSRFDSHTHGGGEEFFVLSGTFCDESGEFPAGFYVRNPPGSSHAPFSVEGCTIFVKLRQMRPHGEPPVVVDTNSAAWTNADPDREIIELFASDETPERVTLERLAPGCALPVQSVEGGEEILVLSGVLEDEHGAYAKGVWIRNPQGTSRGLKSEGGCLLWVKRGHLAPAAP